MRKTAVGYRYARGRRHRLTKTLLVMKLTVLLLTAAFLNVSAKVSSQSVTFTGKNVPLERVFGAVKEQTGYFFLYPDNTLSNAQPVTINAQNMPLLEFLELVFAKQPLKYSIESKTVNVAKALSPAPQPNIPVNDITTAPPVTGRVLNPDGQPLEGASIRIKGSKKGTSTDIQGRFTIDANAGDVIIISYSGLKSREYQVQANTTTLPVIALEVSESKLDEVQVIAYGTTTRRLSTGNVGTVKADVIEKQPITNPLLAIQGRISGVTVTQNSGVPGGGLTVRVQGRNSINSGNDPLYVIDGVPISSQLPEMLGESGILGNSGKIADDAPAAAGNPLNFLNPLDIASIDVLKDADATAIYGSRAANGAILITTKKGKSGKMRADASFQSGWGKQLARLNVLNTRQYLDMRYEAFYNDGIEWRDDPSVGADDLKVWDTTRYTDWQKALLGGTTSFLTATASFSGGSNSLTYLVSGTYGKDGVPFPGDFGNSRSSVHFNISSLSPNQKLRLQFSGNYMNNNSSLPFSDPTALALTLEPNAPSPFDLNGMLNWAPDAAGNSTFYINPYKGLVAGGSMVTNNLIGNVSLGYKLISGMEVSVNVGQTLTQTEQITLSPSLVIPPEDRAFTSNFSQFSNRNLNSLIVEPQLSYKISVGEGRLESLLGGTILNSNTKLSSVMGVDYPSDRVLENLGSAASISAWNSIVSGYKYAAAFTRLTYNLKDRYIVNITARRDGSSRFGVNNRFHAFGALGSAWIFSNTSLFSSKFSWLSLGKLRGSYGTTGNDQISDFRYVTRYQNFNVPVPYQGVSGLTPGNLPNPNLEWELTKKFSIGLDLGFFSDRLTIVTNYSSNSSRNQLGTFFLPTISGFTGYAANFPATVRNTNWEFSVLSENIKTKSVEWSTNINVTIARNKLIAFPNLLTSAYASILEIGKPLSIQKIAQYAGVDKSTGLYKFISLDGDITSTPNFPDDFISINTDPTWYGGISNQIRVGSFTLDFFLQLTKQNGFEPAFGNGSGATPGSFIPGESNQTLTVLNRWQKDSDEATIKKFSSTTYDPNASLVNFSSAAFGDASFARLKNLSFSWLLPNAILKKSRMQSVRFFTQAQNLFTITRYKGLDPEVPIVRPLLPPMRVVTLGFQVIL